jgi:hypothetical protein
VSSTEFALAHKEASLDGAAPAARLDSEAAEIRARLAKAPAIKGENTLGEALGRLLPMSAMTATTFQQGLVSGIAELLIAAALALPELLQKPASALAAAPEPNAKGEDAKQRGAYHQGARGRRRRQICNGPAAWVIGGNRQAVWSIWAMV